MYKVYIQKEVTTSLSFTKGYVDGEQAEKNSVAKDNSFDKDNPFVGDTYVV